MTDSTKPLVLVRDPAAGREPLAEYEARGGYAALERALSELTPEAICGEIERAELRGRGGAAFPVGRKWQLARAAAATVKHVVANGGEHEPGSRKDRVLLATHPHSVLEGMAIAGYATGASHGHLYVIEDMTAAIAACSAAIAEAEERGYLGPDVLGTGFSFTVSVVAAPTTYVAGEETAALEVIEGRDALPREKPPYPGTAGIEGRPTTVNNVETLAHVPLVLGLGAEAYRAIGAPASFGTMLFTLGEEFARPGVYELPFGTRFRELIEGCGGGLASGRGVKAILPATSSAFLPASALSLPLTHDALAEAGSTLGCGGVSVIAEGGCVVERTREIAAFFMAEQCGQCPPCRMETTTLASILDKVVKGDAGEYQAQIERITGFTRGKGRCSLIEMAATPVLSAVRLFPEDFEHHARAGSCPASA